jgi:uncharacterized protein (DUF433 family)
MAVQTSHIEITPGVCGGKPRIAGRRITVENIVHWHYKAGWTTEAIAEQFELTLGEVFGALSYYHDHREEIDQTIREGETFVEEMRQEADNPQ